MTEETMETLVRSRDGWMADAQRAEINASFWQSRYETVTDAILKLFRDIQNPALEGEES